MLSNYKEVLVPLRVPVGVYCFKSDAPFPVTCGNLEFDINSVKCKMFGDLQITKSGRIEKPSECLKLRSGE